MEANCKRHYRWQDYLLGGIQDALRTLSHRPSSSHMPSNDSLTPSEKQLSGALMRINHTGEVCAQALYLSQTLTAQAETLRAHFVEAAHQEATHLSWCETRLHELESHKSYLNPLWFAGAFCIGTFAGLWGDKTSLAFLAETEQQVSEHLSSHLRKLPPADKASRAIVERMQEDEERHAHEAIALGAPSLPFPVRHAMRLASKVMVSVARYI